MSDTHDILDGLSSYAAPDEIADMRTRTELVRLDDDLDPLPHGCNRCSE